MMPKILAQYILKVALFTKKIADSTKHLKENRKDYATQRSLQLMVGKEENFRLI